MGDDPVRVNAIQQMRSAWRDVADAAEHVDMLAWRADAQALLDAPAGGRQPIYRTLAAACVASFLLVSSTWIYHSRASHTDAVLTATDVVRTVRLVDGSTVTLDRRSQVEVHFTDAIRTLVLTHGQARFAVAHDASRPLHVLTAGQDIKAVGTNFNVNVDDAAVVVSLLQGRLLISNIRYRSAWFGLVRRTVPIDPIRLGAGHELVVSRTLGRQVRLFKPDEVVAWERGMTILDNSPLRDAVSTVNRYAVRKIRLDPSVPSGLRISGMFLTDNSDALAENLVALYPQLAVRRRDGALVITAVETRQISSARR